MAEGQTDMLYVLHVMFQRRGDRDRVVSMWSGLGAGLGAAKEEAGHGSSAVWEMVGKGLEESLIGIQHWAPLSAQS